MKNISKILAATFLFIALIIPEAKIQAQKTKIEFEHFSSGQGFSQGVVFAILQDSRGFIWFGTAGGLVRYDGYEFKTFKHNPDDDKSLSYNAVISIYEDNSGILWVGTEGGGLNKYDREKDQFTRYTHDANDPKSLSNNQVFSILQDKSGDLWFGTNGGGVNKLIPGDKEGSSPTFIHYLHNLEKKTSLSSNVVSKICQDKSGNLWIGTENGLNKFVPGDNSGFASTFIHYKHNPDDPTSLSHDVVSSVYEDNSGVLWIGTIGGGLNKLVPGDSKQSTPSFIHYLNDPNDEISLSSNAVGSIYEDNSGNLWIGTWGGGLNKFDGANEQFIRYEFDSNDSRSLGGNWVYSIYEDDSGILWIGTMPGGLNKFDPMKNQFTNYKHEPDDPNSLSSDRVFSIYEDNDGTLWIGTFRGGLARLVSSDSEKSPDSFFRYTHDPNDPKSLSDNSVFSICEDNEGNLWFGTLNGGLNKLAQSEKEKAHPRFIHYENNPDDPTSLSSGIVRVIYKDIRGDLWIGTDGGGLNKLIRGEEFSAKFKRYTNDPKDRKSLSNDRIWSIFEDKRGVLWTGTSGGLNKLIPPKDAHSPTTFICYTHESGDPSSLSNNEVTSIYEDKSGNLWIGTTDGGLNKFDREGGRFIQFDEEDGLANNSISGILEDDEGNLWLSTRRGLSRFNPKTKTFRNYVEKDGLQGNEFQQGAYLKNGGGEMFFGGTNGLTRFHPDSIKDNIRIPPVVITDFQLFNNSVPVGLDISTERSILQKAITKTKEIELTYKDYIISFEFAALDFHIPEKNKYAYTLEGFDKSWNYTDANRRFATYTNLDPGEYTFRVKGSNNDNVWNEEGASIKIIVAPPWWKTWWAYLSYVVLVISVLYGLRRYELNRLNWKNQSKLDEVKLKERAEIDKMKSRFFANISHEFRTPLTLILGPLEKIKPKTTEKEIQKQTGLIRRNASRLLSLVNQLLDLSKLEAGKLKLTTAPGNIVPFVKGIAMSFESIAEHKDILLKVNSLNDDIQLYFDRDKMAKILTNLLSNAFKFTPDGGEITVHINQTDQNSIEIKIRDTGIGISEDELPKLFDRFYQVDSSQTREHEGTGIGLALTKELVELHHGTISVNSNLRDPDKAGTGWTEFTIDLPVGREHLKDEEIVETEEPPKEDIIVDEEQFIPLDAEEASETGVIDEDRNILLVVEDNADVREYIKDSLGDNFEIEEASNGQQGVKKAEKLIPDLIISDVMMPKMDGNELTRILKNDEKTSHIPIILLTAKSEQESRLEGLETGADDYLTKPFDTKELQVRVRNLISIRKKLQEKFGRGEYTPKTEGKRLSNLEEQFMSKVVEVIENHLAEEEFSIEQFAGAVYMSRMQLHRKLKALTGKSASLYVRSFRLLRAKKMIEEKQGNFSEIAYSVGFSSPAYFTKCFKEEFGVPPSELSL